MWKKKKITDHSSLSVKKVLLPGFCDLLSDVHICWIKGGRQAVSCFSVHALANTAG
ncbi:hypothetical protein RHGRI_004873 [Rhododendron griersonianum]|uniref:Uncharacterized protein n=1 Tax=Rhododendron griersonianum TaxID=479676 RepID=A0AAV6LBG6_9ERIC|nr:hypothetical protein RHGRI_004873 [Rhododendron griersonianum]